MMRVRTKYGNRRTARTGYVFDSAKEAARYGELALLQAAGQISELQVHPRFELLGRFEHDGKRERAITYEADFAYVERVTGKYVVEDVKGVRTKVYQIKRKLFLARYGGELDFREVDSETIS